MSSPTTAALVARKCRRGGDFVSVSCPTASFCAAMDPNGNALTYNGSSWSSPDRIRRERLSGGRVLHHSELLRRGGFTFGKTLIYNGSSSGCYRTASFSGCDCHAHVSCAMASFCVAVDENGNALTYNGSSWSSDSTPGGWLTSVSCPTASFCAAVDERATPSPTTALHGRHSTRGGWLSQSRARRRASAQPCEHMGGQSSPTTALARGRRHRHSHQDRAAPDGGLAARGARASARRWTAAATSFLRRQLVVVARQH